MSLRRAFSFACFALSIPALAACAGDEPVEPSGSSGSTTAATTGSGGGTGGSGGGAGGSGGGFDGPPIETPNEEWTWVPFEDAFCGDGSPTGIGVNLTDKSTRVVIYLMGGGACWNNLTCHVVQSASNLDGYADAEFQGDVNGLLGTSLFDRSDMQNPFRDDSYVFVPYCTGDVHSGNNVADHGGPAPIHHVGYANVSAYLQRLVPTFAGAERIVLSGSSAGGFGAALNWGRIREAFGQTVHLIDDSGPPLPPPFLNETLEQAWRQAWNLNAAMPPDCAACLEDLHSMIDYYGPKFPDDRASLLSYTRDNVIGSFFVLSGAKVEEGLFALANDVLSKHPNFRYYYVTGPDHVLLGDPNAITSGGVNLTTWIQQQLDGDAAWANVTP